MNGRTLASGEADLGKHCDKEFDGRCVTQLGCGKCSDEWVVECYRN